MMTQVQFIITLGLISIIMFSALVLGLFLMRERARDLERRYLDRPL